MRTRSKKPIRLKAVAAHASAELRAMQAELEGRSSGRSKPARAIWTREFLASGKPGKVTEN